MARFQPDDGAPPVVYVRREHYRKASRPFHVIFPKVVECPAEQVAENPRTVEAEEREDVADQEALAAALRAAVKLLRGDVSALVGYDLLRMKPDCNVSLFHYARVRACHPSLRPSQQSSQLWALANLAR
jgi:hypothetical protein